MNYSEIKPLDIANGDGIRVSLFVSGCRNHCPGCFNPQTWDFAAGRPFDKTAEDRVLGFLWPKWVAGLTVLGGEPFEPENQPTIRNLLARVRRELPQKTIWAYTGYLLEDLLPGGKRHTAVTDELLSLLDVLVDGPFIEAQKDISLAFRGSDNQRILHNASILREIADKHWIK